MRLPSPLPRELIRAPFTVARATALGVSRTRLQAGDLARPFAGVRVPVGLLPAGGASALPVLASAALLVAPPGSVVAGRTAAALCGLPWPDASRGSGGPSAGAARSPRPPVVLAVPPGGRAPRGAGVEGRCLASAARPHRLRRTGLPVVHPVQLWGTPPRSSGWTTSSCWVTP